MEPDTPTMVGTFIRLPRHIDGQIIDIALDEGESKATVIRKLLREALDARRENGNGARG